MLCDVRVIYGNEVVATIDYLVANRLMRLQLAELVMVLEPTIKMLHPWKEKYLAMKRNPFVKHRPDAMKQKAYGNYTVLSCEGTELFRCSATKVFWYLRRGLIDIISKDTVKLKFVAKGPGCDGDKFNLAAKENRCCVCGKSEELSKHHVVPRIFRRYLDESFKRFNTHDILLLCLDCHDLYEVYSDLLKLELAKQEGFVQKAKDDIQPIKHAKTLLNHPELPACVKQTLLASIRVFLGKEEVTVDDLTMVSKIKGFNVNDGGEKFGEYIVSKCKDIQKFISMWRKHFIDTMSPKFLPEHWDIARAYDLDLRSTYKDNKRK